MSTLQQSYRGLGLVFRLNLELIINVVVLTIALLTGAYIGSL
ncbi:MAG: hypothetical protein ACPG61_09815 [Paracoccaceae bacterium]